MRIVVLDGYAANPGDISWDALRALGKTAIYDRTSAAEIVTRALGADAVLTNKCPMTAEMIAALKGLKYIGVLATGYNIVDVAAARAAGVAVANVPAYSTRAVAQHVFALMLEIASRVGMHARSVAEGEWTRAKDFCFWNAPLTELAGKRLGIVGYGAIGRAVGEIGQAFGMTVAAFSPSRCEKSRLDEIFRTADVLSLNCPLKPDTAEMINRGTLSMMKRGAWLINTARGGLVNEADVADALYAGQLGAYAADVVSVEPIRADNPLLGAPNTILTPHIAWAPYETRVRLINIAVNNLSAFLAGTILNRVDV